MAGSISPDGARAEIVENALVSGNPVKNSSKLKALASYLIYSDSNSEFAASAITASKPVYANSSSVPTTGSFPFAVPVDVTTGATTSSALDITGTSSLSGTNNLGLTLVLGSQVTSFTATGYVRVTLTDSGGNLVNGQHYVQIGSLA